MEAVTL